MIKFPNIIDFKSPHGLESEKNDEDKDSVILFFNNGEIIQFPKELVNLEDIKETDQANAYMYSNENDKAQFLWAAAIFSFKVFNDNTIKCIEAEDLQQEDYVRFFELFDIDYKILDEETVLLFGPRPLLADGINYKVKGRPWYLGIFTFINDNIKLFERFLN